MIAIFKTLPIRTLIVGLMLTVFWAGMTTVSAQNLNQACEVDADSALCLEFKQTQAKGQSSGLYGPDGLLTQVANLVSIITAVAAVVMIMMGGFKFITSGGDQNAIAGARNMIMYAIIGLVVAAIGQLLVVFVLNKVAP